MSRPGFALLTVLWVVLALGVLGTLALHEAAAGSLTSRNRILLARAEWGRRACEQILDARYAERGVVIRLDTVDLGRGTWCTASPAREAQVEGSLLQVQFTAGIHGTPIQVRGTIWYRVAGSRLAVIEKEVE